MKRLIHELPDETNHVDPYCDADTRNKPQFDGIDMESGCKSDLI